MVFSTMIQGRSFSFVNVMHVQGKAWVWYRQQVLYKSILNKIISITYFNRKLIVNANTAFHAKMTYDI